MSAGFAHWKRFRAALLALLVAACASAQEETSVRVRVLVADDLHRPEYALMQWFPPDGAPWPVERVPAMGYLPARGEELATIDVVLGNEPGERRVVVKGMRNGIVISMAAARVPWAPHERQELTLILTDVVPDTDKDGLPDTIDD